MRFVVATSAPRYWLPQIQSIADALGARGHEAIAVTYDSIDEGRKFAADVLFCLGTHQSPQPFLDAALAPTKILYLIESVPTPSEGDDFTRLKLDAHRESLPRFDHVFVHTPRSIPVIAGLGARAVESLYWPHFPNLFYPRPGAEKDIDVLFVGNLSPHRREVLELAAARFKVGHCGDIFHADSTEVYARAKIALNIHATPLKNFECRVTEALGCGAFLLTEALDPDDVLIDGQHLVTFDNQNLLELLDRYLNDAPVRERIARAGHDGNPQVHARQANRARDRGGRNSPRRRRQPGQRAAQAGQHFRRQQGGQSLRRRRLGTGRGIGRGLRAVHQAQ